jgi:arginyl-tRNA synthetase
MYFCSSQTAPMNLMALIRQAGIQAIEALYGQQLKGDSLTVNETKPEFEGDYTLVVFPLTRFSHSKPEETARTIGDYLLKERSDLFGGYNVVKGFLNLSVTDQYCLELLKDSLQDHPSRKSEGHRVMVEYSSPNTNKPLHLGHLRNNFLGFAIANILEATGHDVIKANLVNDRGIHICKSMVAWQRFGNGTTPKSTRTKGDHFVGDYYVKFNEAYKAEVHGLVAGGMDEEEAERQAPIMQEAQEMLRKWELGDEKVRALWAQMNSWVYAGFEETYLRMGVSFDRFYYESETYLSGKAIVEEGLQKGLFQRKEDGSVWIDLTADGLDEKLLLRADGTSVYMTQDLGTAQLKYDDYQAERSIYVIGDEQNYHMKVLSLILSKLGKPYASGIDHLSYGMVELPSGRMKSREGTVVDADDLMDEMVATAAHHTRELGKVNDFSEAELEDLYEILGLGAMKFYLLRVNPRKKMVFNPEESIDFHGFTGSFIQYTHARIRSILRKEDIQDPVIVPEHLAEPLLPLEKALILQLEKFDIVLETAGQELDPSLVAGYAYTLAKIFNSFYVVHSVSQAETPEKKNLRLSLSAATAQIVARSMGLLGIRVPERM